MDIQTLLPDPEAIRLQLVRPTSDSITLVMKTVSPQAICPGCKQMSTRIHSRYVRHLADLPWHGISVRLELHTSRFRCTNSLCPKRIFCERLPRVVAHYARKTVRLNHALELIGLALGGEAGSRLAARLGLKTSPDTLIKRVRRFAARTATEVQPRPPRALGVDDFAFRKGHTYGTIIVDLERRRPLDLLPDREAETLAAWLKAHPGFDIISRDRFRPYAAAISEAAPTAVQVADRWHLFDNVRCALERQLLRHARERQQARAGAQIRTETAAQAASRERLRPHLPPRGHEQTPSPRLPPPPRAAWMLLAPERLGGEERQEVDRFCAHAPAIERAGGLARDFARLIKERAAHDLRSWLMSAAKSGLREFESLAAGLTKDLGAVTGALTSEWSQGQVEGQINRLKLIKRQMYGRGKLDLLKARVLHAV